MTTSIDTNVLMALWDADERLHQAARQALDGAQSGGSLVICGVVYAELLAAPGRRGEFLDRFCEETQIEVEWVLGEKICRTAGAAFQSYAARRKKQGGTGPRRIVADFLIGAHALVNGYRLLTLDGRVYQSSFPGLAVGEV